MILVNSSWPSDIICQHRSGLTLAQVMSHCLMTPSHYLNQCWLIIKGGLWCSSESNLLCAHEVISKHVFEHNNKPVSQICYNTPMFYISAIFVKYCYTASSWFMHVPCHTGRVWYWTAPCLESHERNFSSFSMYSLYFKVLNLARAGLCRTMTREKWMSSLAPERCASNFKSIIFKLIKQNSRMGIVCALRWMPQNLTNKGATLIQVMAWCRQATSHYLHQLWPS